MLLLILMGMKGEEGPEASVATQRDVPSPGKENWLLPHFSSYQLGMRKETY